MDLTQAKLNEMAIEAIKMIEETTGRTCPTDPQITFKINHTKNIAGRANKNKLTVELSDVVAKYRSELDTMNTLVHEILHIVSKERGHKGDWKYLASLFNKSHYAKEFGEVTRTYKANEEQLEAYKYIVECESCHHKYHRQKLTKVVTHPERYTCGVCGGKLGRIK